ncbi:MAG TPA: isomerizing glutamine--fructose-6-phosphate transaminase, partial [Nitrospiraceae bacterium]
MCGIVGYVGDEETVPILIGGLAKLEYRGYDSAGVAVLNGEKIEVRRSVGKLANLQKSLKEKALIGTVGIGHTRWATHGKPSEQNAHPHRSRGCVLVHNGIIENYQPLKHQLEKEGYKFRSETDTEVVAHLIDKYLQQGMKLPEAVRAATKDVRGSYALAVISEREPGTMIAARSGCPLVVGSTTRASFVASDVMAMLAHTRDVTYLEEGDVAVMTATDIHFTDIEGRLVKRKLTKITWDASAAEKSGFPHFMLKEIHEQPQTILDTMRGRYSYDTGEADLPDIGLTPKQFAAVGQIWIVACGTSWHA